MDGQPEGSSEQDGLAHVRRSHVALWLLGFADVANAIPVVSLNVYLVRLSIQRGSRATSRRSPTARSAQPRCWG
jgi:hypothetical protein